MNNENSSFFSIVCWYGYNLRFLIYYINSKLYINALLWKTDRKVSSDL